MSTTVVLTVRRVRQIMQDLSPSNYAVRTERLWEVLARQTQYVAGQLGVVTTWNVAYVTLSVGISEYTLTAAKYDGVVAARASSDGRLLLRLPPVMLEAQRFGSVVPSGTPSYFSLLENDTQQVQMRLDRKPVVGETLDVLAGFLPDYLFDVVNLSGPTAMEASVLPFSDYAMRALELFTAAELIAALTAEERARLGLADGIEGTWAAQAAKFLESENLRYSYMQRPSVVLVRDA